MKHILVTSSLGKLPSWDQGRYEFIHADVNHYDELASVMTAGKFDYVFHYAALMGVQWTLQNPMRVLEGIKNVLRLTKNTGVKRGLLVIRGLW